MVSQPRDRPGQVVGYVLVAEFLEVRGLTVCVLGYGATPLPSIYDALVYDKNVTLSQEEVRRVQKLIDALTDTITP